MSHHEGRVVVITGASAGIGAGLAELLAQQKARLVLVARRERELAAVAARCGDALTIVADVTKRADITRVVEHTIAERGHIDAWVNNAGRAISRVPSELVEEDLDDMMLVNCKSAFFAMQAVLPHFKARNAGHIVNISSGLARIPFTPIRAAYGAAKAALDMLSATMRVELMATHPGIAISVVHPGVVATDFGKNAKHGGPDSRTLPNAQSVADCAAAIAAVLVSRAADAYTSPFLKKTVADYYSADDLGAFEANLVRR